MTLYTIAQVSEMLGLNPSTLYGEVRRQRLVGYRLGKGFKFTDEQVKDYLERCRTKRG